MTTKFSKQDQKRIDDLRGELRDMGNEIETAFEALAEPVAAINALIEAYNAKLTEANGVIEDIASEVESYVDDKSDNWREGERGSAITDWLSELQSFSLEEVELVEVPETPTFDHDGELENIPSEASL